MNDGFKVMFDEALKLWRRFIDDCGGILLGDIQQFLNFFQSLSEGFNKFGWN